jgi:putative endonuclease
MNKTFYVYILTNNSSTLYIGVTSNLIKRIWEHKNKVVKGFTEKYNIDKLIHYEIFEDAENAILREKQLKKWSRAKKFALIRKQNPKFEELTIN